MAVRLPSRGAAVTACAVLAAGIVVQQSVGAQAGGLPANKASAAGATTEVSGPNERVVLLSEVIKTSSPTDLLLTVSLECAITTELSTTGNDSADAAGAAKIAVLIDGRPVPVAQGDADGGQVTFCNRAEGRTTSLFDDEDATIETFQRTRQANAFSWMALNTGAGTHTVEVVGRLTQETTGDATATLAIGNRTLIIEPTKAANNEAVTTIG